MIADRFEFEGNDWRKLYAENRDAIDDFARENGYSTGSEEFQRRATRGYFDGNPLPKVPWYEKLYAAFKAWIRKTFAGKLAKLSDVDMRKLFRDALAGLKKNRAQERTGNGDVRMDLRRPGAPNHAPEKGKIVIGNLENAAPFMEWSNLKGNGLYLDAEFLLGRHPEYFKNQIEVCAACAFVVDHPEKAQDINNMFTCVRKNEENGEFYRIEINPTIKGGRNQIRSIHKINERQYQKAKAGINSPVLQPSFTGSNEGVQQTKSYSDFLKYYTSKYPDVKFSLVENDKKENFENLGSSGNSGSLGNEGSEGNNRDGGIRMAISDLWHGSAADFEKPSLQYVGSGEGNQVFGWGFYASDQKGIGKYYAERDAENKKSFPVLTINGKSCQDASGFSTDWERIMIRHLFSADGDVKKALRNVNESIRILEWRLTGREDDKNGIREDIANLKKIKNFLSDKSNKITFDDGIKGRRNLYKLTFFPEKEENLLLWNKPVPEDQMQKIIDQAVKEKQPFVYTENGKSFYNGNPADGESLYRELCKGFNLGSPQAVSEFLYRAGIDGVKYPANSVGRGDGSHGWNYVAFSDKDIRVDDHTRFKIEEFSDEDMKFLVEASKDFASKHYYDVKGDADFLEFYRRHDLPVNNEHDAHYIMTLALEEVKHEKRLVAAKKAAKSKKINEARAIKEFADENPLFAFMQSFVGNDFVINPGKRFEGTEFAGDYISPEFKKYGYKEARGKRTEKQYQAYLARREAALADASGFNLDEVAQAYASQYGGDPAVIEDEIISLIGDLKKKEDIPLYLATAEAKQTLSPQMEAPDRTHNINDNPEFVKLGKRYFWFVFIRVYSRFLNPLAETGKPRYIISLATNLCARCAEMEFGL